MLCLPILGKHHIIRQQRLVKSYQATSYLYQLQRIVILHCNCPNLLSRLHSLYKTLQQIALVNGLIITFLISVAIDQIKEVRTGRNCEIFRRKEFHHCYNEDRIFSLLYGASYESLDLIAHSPEEANIWITGLNALIGASQCKFVLMLFYHCILKKNTYNKCSYKLLKSTSYLKTHEMTFGIVTKLLFMCFYLNYVFDTLTMLYYLKKLF